MAQVTVEAKYVADTAQYVKALRTAAQATMALADQIPGQVQAQDNLRKSTEALGQGAEEASKGFTILRNAMGTALGVAAVNLVTNVTGRLKGFAKASFDAAARVEELDIAMNSIGEATGLGADTIKDATTAIRNNGIELAAAQQIAIEFAQNQLDLASASKVARVAQDLAVIAGQNSTATTQLLTQAIITGNSMLLKSAGISRLASEGYAEYAKQIGKSVRQLSAQERQQAVTNLILQEGERVAGTYEGAMNAAGKVLRSFKRIINDIQIEIGKILLNAFGPLIKSTYDLLKAFSKSVRDGGALSGTLTMLSENFQTLTEPLVEFIKNLTESVKSGEAMTNIGTAVETIIPPLMTAVETVRALGAAYASVLIPALRALTPLLTAVANLITPVLNLFTRLPEPIRMVVGLFVLLQIAMARSATAAKIFGTTWAQLQTKFVMAFVGMANAITAFEVRWKAARASSVAGMGVFAAAAKLMAAGFVASVRVMVSAARTLMASIGPLGWALIGASVAFEVFSGKSAKTETNIAALRDTLEETTGAFTDLTKATIENQLRMELSPQDQAMLREMGVGVEAVAAAFMEGGPALDQMIGRIEELRNQNSLLGVTYNNVGSTLETYRRMVTGKSGEVQRLLAQEEQASLDAAAAQERLNAEGEIIARTALEAGYAVNNLGDTTEAAGRQALEAGYAYDEQARKTYTLSRAQEVLTGWFEASKDAFADFNSVLSKDNALIATREAVKKLSDSLKENGKSVSVNTEKGRENRKAANQLAKSYIELAQSAETPAEQLEILAEGEAELRDLLGKKYDKLPVAQALEDAKNTTQDYADEWKVAAREATEAGNDVGKNFIEGIIVELEKGKDAAAAAAAEPVEAMLDAANAAQQSQSPSKKTMKIAKDFIAGLVVGIRKDKKIAETEVSDMGQDLLNALESRLQEFQRIVDRAGEAFSAMREMTREPFGEPSRIIEAFGEGGNIGGAISAFDQLDAMIRDAYAPFLDAEIVGERQAAKATKAMERERNRLKKAAAQAIAFMKERDAALEDMAKVRDKTAEKIKEINDRYDDLDASAQQAIKDVQSRWDGIIPGLERALSDANAAFERENRVLDKLISDRDSFLDRISSGIRGFVNDLGKVTKKAVKVTKDLGNGITVTTETEVADESSFRANLEARLQSVREFTANIRTLLARGLDPSLVQEFVSAGVGSAGDTVAALAGAADSEISAINSAQTALNAEIASFQETASAQWYDAGIAQQEAVVAPLRASAEAAQAALDQARAAREQEVAAAQAHAEMLRNLRRAEIAQAEADRDAELKRLQGIVDNIQDNELPERAAAIQAIFTNLQTTMPPQMRRIGREAIKGIIAGINKKEPALMARARQIGNAVRAELERALRISSPSKVTQTIGEQVAQGLIDGMKASERSVARAAGSLADQVTAPMSMPSFPSVSVPSMAGASMTGGYASGGDTTIHINVNAGMGADGAEVGRQILEALSAYERRNGKVYANA